MRGLIDWRNLFRGIWWFLQGVPLLLWGLILRMRDYAIDADDAPQRKGSETMFSSISDVISACDALPAGCGSWLKALSAKVSPQNFYNLLKYLWTNHTARDQFIADCQAGDIGKAIDDLIADYNAANPPTPIPTP